MYKKIYSKNYVKSYKICILKFLLFNISFMKVDRYEQKKKKEKKKNYKKD